MHELSVAKWDVPLWEFYRSIHSVQYICVMFNDLCCVFFVERFWVLVPDCLMVLFAEVLVDWIKHAFITRFNELPVDVYRDYTISLAYDMAQTRQKHVSMPLFYCHWSCDGGGMVQCMVFGQWNFPMVG